MTEAREAASARLTRDQLRSRRPRKVRARTESTTRTSHLLQARGRFVELLERSMLAAEPVPKTRGDCVNGARPCPHVRCTYHLLLDVTDKGNIKWNFPDAGVDLEQLPETCALDVADRGGLRLEDVGKLMNMTRERVRQIERVACNKLMAQPRVARLLAEIAGVHDGR